MAISRPLDVVNAKKWKELSTPPGRATQSRACILLTAAGATGSDPDIDFAFNLLDDEIYELTKHH